MSSSRTPKGQGPANPQRLERQRSEKAALIRHAAYQCFAERGFHETTVDQICVEAGVSKGTFYWYFESKDEAFRQILDGWSAEVEKEVLVQFRGALAGDGDPLDLLLEALLKEGGRARAILPILLDAMVQAQDNTVLKEAVSQYLRRTRRVIGKVLAPTLLDHTEQQRSRIAGLLLSLYIGGISLDLADSESLSWDEMAAGLIDVVRRYIVKI